MDPSLEDEAFDEGMIEYVERRESDPEEVDQEVRDFLEALGIFDVKEYKRKRQMKEDQ